MRNPFKLLKDADKSELIFYMIGPVLLLIAAVVVGIPLAVMFAIVSLITMLIWAAIAALMGIVVGLLNFVHLTAEAHETAAARPVEQRQPPRLLRFIRHLYDPQPAALIYMIDSGWFVIAFVFGNVWRATGEDADNWLEKAQIYIENAQQDTGNPLKQIGGLWLYAAAGGMVLGGLFHFVAAFLIVVAFATLQAGFLLIGAVVSLILMLIIGATNTLYGQIYRMYFRCPNCHDQMRIPVHVCPGCGRKHTRLWPSIYGVFRHSCACGEKLPTVDILGRRRIVQRCPSCDNVLNEAIGRATNIHIPIVGGPSAGKTHYIVSCTRELIETYAPSHNLEITMPDTQHRRDYEANVRILNRGQQLGKTAVEQDSNTRAYNLQIKRRWHPVPTLLYIYDGAGEYYTDQESAAQQVYYRYVNGFIMIVDPFSLDTIYQQYKPRLATHAQTLAVNTQEPLSSIYERMLETLEIHFHLRRGVRFPHPIAVVLPKVDAFDLEEKIGVTAARQEMRKDDSLLTEGEAVDRLVQRFLTRNGAGNFVRNLHAQFSDVRFFSCSSTGRMISPTNHSPLRPVRILEPLLWLMAENHILPLESPQPDTPTETAQHADTPFSTVAEH